MSIQCYTGPHARRTLLAVCTAAAFGILLSSAEAGERPMAPHFVTSCLDDYSPGTLRYEVDQAISGETIDMSGLVCSTITLDGNWPTPSIQLFQDSLTLKGPANHTLTIDAGAHGSVFRHAGVGTLEITDLSMVNGKYVSDASPFGGCIYSAGNVKLTRSSVSSCELAGIGATPACAGAVYTSGYLTLTSSTITASVVSNIGSADSFGGGVFARGDLNAYYSTISDNSSYASQFGNVGLDGGATVYGNVNIGGSTVSGNKADFVGGIDIVGGPTKTAAITNSTISTNTAAQDFGGIWTNVPLTFSNSTLAFNKAMGSAGHGAGGLFSSEQPLTLQSSILTGNAGPGDGPNDLDGSGNANVTAVSANNVVNYSTLPNVPLMDCPQLGPLADNGGPTLTHMISATSLALDFGNNIAGLVSDQRLVTRTVGIATDIGAVERQPNETDDRVFVSGFSWLCDQ